MVARPRTCSPQDPQSVLTRRHPDSSSLETFEMAPLPLGLRNEWSSTAARAPIQSAQEVIVRVEQETMTDLYGMRIGKQLHDYGVPFTVT